MNIAIDAGAVAQELGDAYAAGTRIPRTLSSRPGFDLAAAYAVEAELVRRRHATGHRVVGRKVAFANAAVWPKLNLDTVAWASMYDDTVHVARSGSRTPLPFTYAPKLEPEIVFRLKTSVEGDPADPESVLGAVEWLSLGYEIVDSPFPEWQFQPPDLVAAFGFHAGLVLGQPTSVTHANRTDLADQLARFSLELFRNDTLVEQGGGRNVLESPALALGELAAAIRRTPGAEPLRPGELISTGSLTTPRLIARGETWRAEPHGLDVAPLTVSL